MTNIIAKFVKLLAGQEAQKSTKRVEGENAVDCLHTSIHPTLNKGERYNLNWRLDFSKMTESEILEAAAEHMVIKIRRVFTGTKNPKCAEWDNVTFDCSEFNTKRVSKVDKIAREVSTWSDEQLAAMGLSRVAE